MALVCAANARRNSPIKILTVSLHIVECVAILTSFVKFNPVTGVEVNRRAEGTSEFEPQVSGVIGPPAPQIVPKKQPFFITGSYYLRAS